MPTITAEEINGYAHCNDAWCEGTIQERVPAIRETHAFTYEEQGGDLPFVQNTHSYLRFRDEKDAACPFCERPREVADQQRPTYQNISGYAQDFLLNWNRNNG